jgi:hypothetical protein
MLLPLKAVNAFVNSTTFAENDTSLRLREGRWVRPLLDTRSQALDA